MARGGARAGAGRKSTREKYARPIAAAEKQVADALPELIGNMLTLARGFAFEDPKHGFVYRTPPDRAANEYLINRIMGKPSEHKEVTGPDGGPVQTVSLTLEQWRAQAAQRLAQAEAALAAAEGEPETDAP